MPQTVCPKCGSEVEYHRAHCSLGGHFVGFPNVRAAEAMRAALQRNYEEAVNNAIGQGVESRLRQLKALLAASVATINVSAKVAANIALGDKYDSYYKTLEQGLRQMAEAEFHAHRRGVDAKIHTGYEAEILNAALSPDGRGLINYGSITLELHEAAVADRATVIRENAFLFYERYDLGRREAKEAPGWRATWTDRALLGVAHLAPAITPELSEEALPSLILSVGADRLDNRYMEVQIHGEIRWQALAKVSLSGELAEASEREEWELAVQKLRARSVDVVDSVAS